MNEGRKRFVEYWAAKMRDPAYRAAYEDIAAGRVRDFDNVEDLIASLHERGLITPAKRKLRVASPPLKLEGKSLTECLDEVRGED